MKLIIESGVLQKKVKGMGTGDFLKQSCFSERFVGVFGDDAEHRCWNVVEEVHNND